jgi:hypothetical protein
MRKTLSHQFRRVAQSRYGIIGLVLAVNLFIGLWIVGDYSESWDEWQEVTIGLRAVGAYRGTTDYSIDDVHNYYGPLYNMLAQGAVSLSRLASLTAQPVTIRHFTNFLTFQLAVFALYTLCLRFAGKVAALGAALLFASQPLFFGHAFINPKDVPLMAFFLAVVAAGAAMVSAYEERAAERSDVSLRASVAQEWRSHSIFFKIMAGIAAGLVLIVVLDVLLLDVLVLKGRGVLLSAGSRVTVWEATYPQVQVPIVLGTALISGLIAAVIFPWTTKLLWCQPFYRLLIVGGALAGCATSIRVIGPFAGVLVSIYFVFRARVKAVLPLAVYWGIATWAVLASWPYLWDAPVWHLLESVWVMGHFAWPGEVLYRGTIYESGTLPQSYIPHALSMQFTEAVVLLVAIGVGVWLWRARWRASERPLMVLVVVPWLVLPLALLLALGASAYDNLRHFLYAMPPLFIVAGIGLDALLNRLGSDGLKVVGVALALAPGILGIVRLHPYEYAYYNSFVGGVRGAFRSYELDYWCLSYGEAIAYVNEVSPPDAEVGVWGPDFAVAPYARSDLAVYWVPDTPGPRWEAAHDPEFVLICARSNMDQRLYPDAEVVREVSQRGVIFGVVKKID